MLLGLKYHICGVTSIVLHHWYYISDVSLCTMHEKSTTETLEKISKIAGICECLCIHNHTNQNAKSFTIQCRQAEVYEIK
ncbi:Hypothetical predicted protein [Octopus vulgaris]|uniref:Uncharacterized protein n=1 Tax=Octopus vulgaris TaxID=6645 RepID=A0AA36F431_OCTVU|nr:Hypothetical predicted protein [Octopus vulgaris]